MLEYKSELFGLLCSDGNHREYLDRSMQFDKRRGKYYQRNQFKRLMEFANIDIPLLKHFQDLLIIIYDYPTKIILSNHNVKRVCISKNYIVDDIKSYIKIGKDKWFVPRFILNGTKKVRINFIQGYFDGDGCADITKDNIPRIRFSSTNLNGLKQVQTLISSLGINTSLNGPYKREGKRDSYELLLKTKSIERFIKYIKSNHSKKKHRLNIIAEICRDRYNNHSNA